MKEYFDVCSSKKIFHANQVKIYQEQVAGSYPYVVRATKNNGVKGYIIADKSYLNDGQTLSFAQDTFTVFYQSQKYFTGNKVKILKPKFDKVSDKILRYFVASFNVALDKLSWGIGSTVKSINSIKISLPMKNREIDFDFMEKFISDLEVERLNEIKNQHIDEISAYMSVVGSN